MAVELAELVEAAQAEVNAPGENLFPGSTDEQWEAALVNAFWTAKVYGKSFPDHRVDPTANTIVNVNGGDDLPREQQQIIVMYVAYNAIRNKLLNIKTMIRGQAGPVEGELQRSANLLIVLFKDVSGRLEKLVTQLQDDAESSDGVYLFDLVWERDFELRAGLDTFWN